MYALVDCNSFFCSVEKVFHPGLAGKPVCVLSGNDGIIVALTPEAKAIGLHRGDALFKVRETVERENVAVFSGNIMLYSAMSKRIVSILRQSVHHVESYSIDECFCDLTGYENHYDLTGYMRDVAQRIKLWTDIPVSIGIAPTKTLAKMGSKYAKNYRGYRSVCTIDSEEKRRKALEMFDLGDIWGLGRRTCEKLLSLGIRTPLDFADRNADWVRSHLTKPGVQTWMELNGRPCIDTSEMLQRQTIRTCRSFGEMVTSLTQLKPAVASFAASCACTLRSQRSVAGAVTVFLCSNRFREDLDQYWNCDTIRFRVPTADTIEITSAALRLLPGIYRAGIRYKKAGVILSCISPDNAVQQILFDDVPDRPERMSLSRTMDQINHKFGLKSVRLAVECAGPASPTWKPKCGWKSHNYLTDINDLLTIDV
jgi:Nucleotidyltransferase/DNA polymerase involved in DNA repair